jgi:murein DD-endopeptidase MepM/ murein hydrolase activator NlpD
MTLPRRVLLVLVALACACVPAFAAGATTGDDLDAARQKLTDARNAANETAAAFSESDHKLEETRAGIEELKSTIATTKVRQEALRVYARQRAVYAYTHPGNSLQALIDASDAVDAARRSQLLDLANQTDADVVKKLAAVNATLKRQQADLQDQEQQQQVISDQLDAKLKTLQAKQSDVERAVADLQTKLDAEIAVAAFADATRKAELERERAALALQQTISSGGAGQIVASPVPGPFQCPVQGAAYSNDYTGPEAHAGIDMFVPTGTVAVAVKAGTVRYVPNEGAGGNTAYLLAEDGNTYFYAHFSQFIGEGRTVAKGEVIGLTGMTGNASAPHVHFEIRLGGDNGYRTNPYPTLKAAGC